LAVVVAAWLAERQLSRGERLLQQGDGQPPRNRR
jgi:hypothetical protein